jgi:hypothetical protein
MFYLASALVCAFILACRYDSLKQKSLEKYTEVYKEKTNLNYSTMFAINAAYLIFMPLLNTKFAYQWLTGAFIGCVIGWSEKDE